MSDPLLRVENLKTYFPVKRGLVFEKTLGTVKAVDDVSLTLKQGEILGLVGESGCGKSTLARTILRLVKPTSGYVWFEGANLAALSPSALRAVRPRIQMVFQDPYASLNPRRTVFDTLAEPLLTHRIVSRQHLTKAVSELMEKVGLAPRFMRKYPHEFSGGQRQRIAIARALAPRPKLILADEPVSALDVSVQAQILNLLHELCAEEDLTMILIAHDLSVVRHMAHRIAVMYLGRIVEEADTNALFQQPLHPYTMALLEAIPRPDPVFEQARDHNLLTGDPPSPMNPPTGCAFHPRCPHAEPECVTARPDLREFLRSQRAACVRLEEIHAMTPTTPSAP
jgi:oligopeptide transport system ATP-binding protein